jgi:hypothetical protein
MARWSVRVLEIFEDSKDSAVSLGMGGKVEFVEDVVDVFADGAVADDEGA